MVWVTKAILRIIQSINLQNYVNNWSMVFVKRSDLIIESNSEVLTMQFKFTMSLVDPHTNQVAYRI